MYVRFPSNSRVSPDFVSISLFVIIIIFLISKKKFEQKQHFVLLESWTIVYSRVCMHGWYYVTHVSWDYILCLWLICICSLGFDTQLKCSEEFLISRYLISLWKLFLPSHFFKTTTDEPQLPLTHLSLLRPTWSIPQPHCISLGHTSATSSIPQAPQTHFRPTLDIPEQAHNHLGHTLSISSTPQAPRAYLWNL
jgi:hypothetical protein